MTSLFLAIFVALSLVIVGTVSAYVPTSTHEAAPVLVASEYSSRYAHIPRDFRGSADLRRFYQRHAADSSALAKRLRRGK